MLLPLLRFFGFKVKEQYSSKAWRLEIEGLSALSYSLQ